MLLLFVAIVRRCSAQGGPPMITDDPGTPGNRKWEINLAVTLEHRPGETSLDLPEVDLNYGIGENIQLTLQTAPVLLDREGHGPIAGLGGTEAAVKWRFLDEATSGIDASMFPRIIFNVVQSSVRRGLAEDGTRFQIPIELAKKFGVFHADVEGGPLVSTVGRGEWLYGVVGGIDISKTTTLMAELNGTSRTNFTRDSLVVNFGLRHEFSETRIFITSLGHEVRSSGDQPLAWIGYFGMQLIY
ncbi:MAG TPA: hypothetical protein VNW28_10685 [Chthoniobacterales bacterium]|nr:hypothetical protein [Chthoniobacterales bacterium]